MNKQYNNFFFLKKKGLVEVSIQDLNPSGRPLDKWFPILSVKNDQKSSKGSESNIRMKFALTVETILPYREYQEFLEVLFHSFDY